MAMPIMVNAQEKDSLSMKLKELAYSYQYSKIVNLLEEKTELKNEYKEILADAQMKCGRFFEALNNYEALYSSDSSSKYLLKQANIYDKVDEEAKALSLYIQLADKEVENPYFWKLAAKSALKQAEYAIAFKCYTRVLELQNDDIEAVAEFSGILIKTEYFEDADSLLRKTLEIHPNANILKRKRLMALYRQRKYEEVVAVAEELFEDLDSNLVSIKIAGIANYHLKNYKEAVELLEMVIKVERDSDLLHYYAGLSYRELGELEKATKYLEKSIDLSVSDNLPNYYTQLAVCYEEDGQTAKAIQAYKIAYKETKDKVLLYHLARNYDVLYKDKKVALSYYEKYLEEKDTANEYLMNYSKYRIQELKAGVHFEADSF